MGFKDARLVGERNQEIGFYRGCRSNHGKNPQIVSTVLETTRSNQDNPHRTHARWGCQRSPTHGHSFLWGRTAMPASGWKQLLAGVPSYQGEGRYPIPPYSEYTPPPLLGAKPYPWGKP